MYSSPTATRYYNLPRIIIYRTDIGTSGTTPTLWLDDATNCTSTVTIHLTRDYSNLRYEAPAIIYKPKNWRWFHCFFKPSPIYKVRLPIVIPCRVLRTQERFSLHQRSKQKRRNFVQQLHRGIYV
jgi:hypothetical protein